MWYDGGMARRLRCPRCQSSKYWILQGDRRRCAVCRHDWRPNRWPLRLTSREWGHLLGWFVRGASSVVIAQETGLHRQRVLRALTLLRQRMAREVPPVFQGEVEIDETYVGGAWKNKRKSQRALGTKRGRGTSKAPVFGILCRGGQVWAKVVPDVHACTLWPLIRGHVRRGSIIYSDTWKSYTGIATKGYVHRLVHHTKGTYGSGKNHINGLEGFWGYLKRRLVAKGGIRHDRLPLYLAEYVWRYNHRRLSHKKQVQELMSLLKKIA